MSREEFNQHPHTICGVIEKWAKERPDKTAFIIYDTEKEVTYKEFNEAITAMAFKLYNMGFRKGDIIATSLPFLYEHIILGYACAKLGVMWTPMDLRLKPPEIMKNLDLLKEKCKMYCHLGKTSAANFGMIGAAVKKNTPWLDYVVQFSAPDDKYRSGIIPAYQIAEEAKNEIIEAMKSPESMKEFMEECTKIGEEDPIIIVFTTGSTGWPKPAMLTNKSITCQNLCLGKGFDIEDDDKMLVNLPPSHVGGTTEQFMTPMFFGATCVVLHIFDPEKTLDAIQKYKVTTFGQIPALFVMEWRLPNYNDYDISSLKFALYGGQAVDRPFLEKLSSMAPKFGSGFGLTESSGFCTYTPLDGTVDDILAGLGTDYPIYPMNIRNPMKEDGSAGDELPDGEIGEICFQGPQNFLGYFGNEEATRATLSTDGVLYTGDMGFKDDSGLHLSGRRKYLIKPKGYQVFPPEVESFIAEIPQVEFVGVVGAKHEVFTDGIIAYIKVREGETLTEEDVYEHCKGMAAYKRPSLVVFLDEFPLNRVAKTDYVVLKERVEKDVEEARAKGGWDAK
ncbi:MAG: acyl--CoA ligase [Promethearchaeota archaeon]|nr:MAG: acyl--CoA ligase [Candidatus Lokiarchaeota archaeon]